MDRFSLCDTVRTGVLALTLAMALAACGDSSPSVEDAPEVSALLGQSATAMQDLESARFMMDRTGAPVVISGMEFVSAEGQYDAPRSAQSILDMVAGGITLELGTISIDERTWLTNPLTGGWEELPAGTGFNPAVLFDPGVGWVPLLTDDISGAEVDRVEDGAYVVTGTAAAERVAVITAGLVEDQEVGVELWIGAEDSRLQRLEFSTEGDEGRSDWVVELSEFDEPVTIDPPTDG